MTKSYTDAQRIRRALLIAALMVAGTFAIAMLRPEYVSRELSNRIFGVAMGLFVLAYANVLPKQLVALDKMKCDPTKEQALRRFTGWVLSLAGLGYAVIWMVAPVALAKVLATAVLATGMLIVIARLITSRR